MNAPVQQNNDEGNDNKRDRLREFEKLYNKFSPLVFGYLQKRLFNDHDAEQLAAEAWVKALAKFELSQVSRFKPLILTIAKNHWIDWLKKNRPDLLPEDYDPATELSPSSTSSNKDEQLDALRECIQSIDEPLRSVLLARLAGQKDKEISSQYDMPMGTVAKRLHTVRAKLKLCVEGRLA